MSLWKGLINCYWSIFFSWIFFCFSFIAVALNLPSDSRITQRSIKLFRPRPKQHAQNNMLFLPLWCWCHVNPHGKQIHKEGNAFKAYTGDIIQELRTNQINVDANFYQVISSTTSSITSVSYVLATQKKSMSVGRPVQFLNVVPANKVEFAHRSFVAGLSILHPAFLSNVSHGVNLA